MDRRAFLGLLATAGFARGCKTPRAANAGGGVEEASIAELAERMARGDTSVAITRAYLARIEAIDKSGPTLRAVLETNPDALAIAARLDDERRAGRVRGPLHGVPILVKDNIDTGDRMQTTAGSLALAGAPAPGAALAAARRRGAGAGLRGPTNQSAGAHIRSDYATSGWSARGGLVKNPHALDRSASGSSSGSAAGVAAGLAAAALGTETIGSIVSPASACGVVGLKPTVGLVSRSGVIPISHSCDTAGPIARSVSDAALVLAAIAGADARDPATKEARFYPPRLDGGMRGTKLGIVRRQKWLGPAQKAVFDAAVGVLRSLGAEIVDDLELPRPPFDAAHVVLMRELVTDMRAYLEARGGPMRSLEDLVRFDREHAREEMRWFGQDLFEAALEKGGTEAADHAPALEACRKAARENGLDPLLAKVDVLVAPTSGPAWTTDLVNGDHFIGGSAFLPAVAGYPHLTVPCGFVHELPVGISFFAGAWSEATLLRVGYAYEQASRARKPPRYVPTVG